MFIRRIKEALLRLIARGLRPLLSFVSHRLQATDHNHSSQLVVDYNCGESPADVIDYEERAPEHWRRRVTSQAPPHWLKRVRATVPQLIAGAYNNVILIQENEGHAVKADSPHPRPDSADTACKRENARGARRPAPTFNPADNSDSNEGPHPAAEPDRRKLAPPDMGKRSPVLNSTGQEACSLSEPMKSRGEALPVEGEITKQHSPPKLPAEFASQDAQEYGAGLKQIKSDIAEDSYAAGRSSNDAQPARVTQASPRSARDAMMTHARPNAPRNSYQGEQPGGFRYSPTVAAFPPENACGRQRAFEDERTSSFEHYEDPWPALPDAPIIIEADEIIIAFRKCERLRKLDGEQRGTLWNA